MAFFKKRPVVIEAHQLPAANELMSRELHNFLHDNLSHIKFSRDGSIIIHTLEGDMTASPLDWIIKGVQGEMYPCKPDVFAETYEKVEK